MQEQEPTAVVRCPVCSMPFHHDRSTDNSTDATSSAGFTGHAGDRTPSSHSSYTHAAIPAPRSNGSLLPLHPHMLVPPGPASGRSTSGPWDDDSPMVRSATAVAELFPHEPWLKRRLHLPVSVGDLLPALRGEPVGKAAWMQLVARYRLPQSMLLHRLRAESASHALGAGRSSRRAHLVGDPAATRLGIIYSPPLSPSADDGSSGTPASAQHAVSLPELQAEVAPHVALQLLPAVWQHMQPLLGYIVDGGGAEAGPPGSQAGPRVGLLYAEQGVRLPEYMRQRGSQRGGGTPVLAWQLVVDILQQLAAALTALHGLGFCLGQLCPFRYSTIFLHAVPGAQHVIVKLSMSAVPADASDPPHIRRADTLCVPPEEGAAGPAADVWRAASVALLALAAHHLPSVFDGRAAAHHKSDMLRQLCVDAPCDLFSILQSCLQEDPEQRWTAERMASALASIPNNPDSSPPGPASPKSTGEALAAAAAARGAPASMHGPASAYSAFGLGEPHSVGEAAGNFARVRVPQSLPLPDTEIFGVAMPSHLPALVHVRPVPPGGKGRAAAGLSCKSKLLIFLVPLTLMVVIPVLIARWAAT